MTNLVHNPCPLCELINQFKIGDKVQKVSGSQWRGTVVGFYLNTSPTSLKLVNLILRQPFPKWKQFALRAGAM